MSGPYGGYGARAAGDYGGYDVAVGLVGTPGPPGQGVPSGGTAGQVLEKVDGSDYHTTWGDPLAIDDSTPSTATVYSSAKIVSESPLAVGAPSGDTTGATDTALVTAALAKVPAGGSGVPGGADLLFSAGKYYLNAGITASVITNLRLRGMGKRATALVPVGNLSGAPIVKLIDCRDAQVEDLWIWGLASGQAPAAIQSYRAGDAATIGGSNGHGLRVSRCILGSDGGVVGIATGVQWATAAADASHDTNNDMAVLDDVEIFNFGAAAVDIAHFNSLQHIILGGIVSGGPTFVRCAGGSFTAFGTRLGPLTGYAFDFLLPYGVHNYYTHRSAAIGLMAESKSPIARASSAISGTGPLRLNLIGVDWSQAPSSATTMFDWQAPGSALSVIGSTFDFGQLNMTASFTDANSVARFIDSALGLTGYSYNGRLIMRDNKHIPSSGVTLTNLGSGKLDQLGDSSGGFTADTLSRSLTVAGTLSQSSGTPTLPAVSGSFGVGATNNMVAGSTDTAMEVGVTSGTSGFAANPGQQVNFSTTRTAAPKTINITPMNLDTANLGVPYISSKGTANFVFRAPGTPVASKSYAWDIACVF